MHHQPHTRTDNQAPPIVTHTEPPPFVVRQHPTVPRHYQRPTVIEKTGKAFKIWMLIGGLMAMLGGGFVVLGSFAQSAPIWGIGFAIGVMGVGTWIIARMAAWWGHG